MTEANPIKGNAFRNEELGIECYPQMMQKEEEYLVNDYPWAMKAAEEQRNLFWPPDEMDVSSDLQSFLVDCTEAERHGVNTVTGLFTKYEVFAGDEYWGGRFKRMFPRPSLRTMGNAFSFFETNIHTIFYSELDKIVHEADREFYTRYLRDPVLASRVEWLDKKINHRDPLISLGIFSMVEGAILYSSFAFLKHFQSEGKNKLPALLSGINFSVRDENLHSMGGAAAYQSLMKEVIALNPEKELKIKTYYESQMKDAAIQLAHHESLIVDKIFEKGEIQGINEWELNTFINSRLNLCLQGLGHKETFLVGSNPIKNWFYKGINSVQFKDFFTPGVGNEYNRKVNREGFRWVPKAEREGS